MTTTKTTDRQKLEADAIKVIEQSRAIIRKQVPYLSSGIDALAFVFVHGVGDTFACDEKYRIFCDPAYCIKAGPKQLAADILHEKVVHIMGEHFTRADALGIPKEDRRTWNIAGDMAGNGTLFEIAAQSDGLVQPMGMKIDLKNLSEAKKKTTMVTAERYGLPDGLTVEEYFQKLKEKEQQEPEDPEDGDGQPGDGEPQEGKGGQQPQGKRPQPPVNPGDPGGGGSGKEKQDGGAHSPRCGGCAGDGDLTDQLAKQAAEQGADVPDGRDMIEQESIKQREAMAIQQHIAGRGSAPAGFKRWAEMVKKKPKVNWRKHLSAMVSKGIGKAKGQVDFTNTRLRKRQNVLLPTMYAPTPVVAMVLDTSGSMTDRDLGASLREVRGVFEVLQQGGATEVWITACDTRATKPVKLKKWNEEKVQSILQGGGGTDMGAGIMAAATVKPSITVVCTDGDTGWPTTKPTGAGKVIIAVTRESVCPTPSWATAVVKAYDSKD